MKCPNCKLENPPSALRCDCGYDFSSGTVKASYLSAMATTSAGPAGVPQASQHWLWVVRIAALASVLCIAIAGGFLWVYDREVCARAHVYGIFMFPVLLGYIWVVVGLWGRKVKNGLALGLGLGSLAPLILVLTVALLGHSDGGFDWVVVSSVGLLFIPQVALGGCAIKAYYTLPRQAGDKATLWLGLGEAAVLVAIFAVLWIGSNGLVRSG